jgi:WD40 repeat protein
MIRELIAIPEEDYLVSASDDKTIKVWDTRKHKLVRNILGQITEKYGEIYAIALSPNRRYLAVSVNYPYYSIRIHRFADGEIHKVLRTKKQVVKDISFSPDNRYLVTASDRMTIWNVDKDFEKESNLVYLDDPVKDVMIFPYQNDYRIIYADGKQIFMYSKTKDQIINEIELEENILSIAFSKNRMACACPKSIVILDLNLEKVSQITTQIIPNALSFSPNGQLLLTGAESDPYHCFVYKITHNHIQIISTFKRHNNTVSATTFMDDNTAVTAGGNDKEIFVWDIKNGKIVSKFRGCGKTIWAVGLSGQFILWGDEFERIDSHQYGRLFQKLNINTFQIEDIYDTSAIGPQLQKTYQSNDISYSLTTIKGGPYNKENAVLLVNASSGSPGRIVRNNVDGYVHNIFGFTKNGLIVSGGANGQLIAYSVKGNKRVIFAGHTGEIMALAIDSDQARMVSAGTDQQILLWDLSNISDASAQTLQTLQPLVGFFFAQNKKNKWVAWTPEGFFALPEKNTLNPDDDTIDKYIGYHFNRGVNNAAQYINFDQVWKLFNRNDLVKSRLLNASKANKEIQMAKEALGDALISVLSQPPKIIFDWDTSEPIFHNESEIDLSFDILDSGGGIGDIVCKINAKSVNLYKMKKQSLLSTSGNEKLRVNGKLRLIDGRNVIQIKANNKNNTILSNEVNMNVYVDLNSSHSSLRYVDKEFCRQSVRSIERSTTNNKQPPKLIFFENISKPFKQNSTSFILSYAIENKGAGIGKTVYKVNGKPIENYSSRRKKLSKQKFIPPPRENKNKNETTINEDIKSKQNMLESIKEDALDNMITEELHLTLNPGRNIIQLSVSGDNQTIISKENTIIVDVENNEELLPSLYILSMGVSKYKDSSIDLKYAASDAEAFLETLTNRAKPIFGSHIYSKLLMDRNVTYDHIEKGFMQFSEKMKPYDVFVLFIAGHGIDIDGDYFFIPYDLSKDGDKETLKNQSISHNQLYFFLSMISAQKTVVILDTCYSGLFISRPYLISNTKDKIDSAIARLRHGGGCAFITSSSSRQVSLEGYQKFGVLTYALLKGMKAGVKQFLKNTDGLVTIHGLSSYVREEVPRITQEKWHYAQVPTSLLYNDDFPFCYSNGNDAQ